MGGRTGFPDLTNGVAFGFAEYIEPVEDHFDALIGETAPDAASLPSSGNWLGRLVMAEDTGVLYKCIGLPSTWQKIQAAPFVMETRTVSIAVNTPNNNIATVTFTSGTFTQAPLVFATIQSSPGVGRKLNAQVTGISTTQFQLVLSTGDGTTPSPPPTISVAWWAIQMFPSAAAGVS